VGGSERFSGNTTIKKLCSKKLPELASRDALMTPARAHPSQPTALGQTERAVSGPGGPGPAGRPPSPPSPGRPAWNRESPSPPPASPREPGQRAPGIRPPDFPPPPRARSRARSRAARRGPPSSSRALGPWRVPDGEAGRRSRPLQTMRRRAAANPSTFAGAARRASSLGFP